MGIRRPRWTCCHFSLYCGSDAGCSNKRVTTFRLEGQKGDGEPPFFVSLSFIFKLRCRVLWPWMHLNLQNLTLSSINLYIRPSGACIELYKLSLSGWNNTISVEKLCFFFFFDRLEIKIEAFSLYWFFFFLVQTCHELFFWQFFFVVCFCYAACFPWQLSCTNTYLFNVAISRVFAT